MRRRLLIALLALGTVGGYGAGFASLHCHARHNRDTFERHVAALCADAARQPPPPAPFAAPAPFAPPAPPPQPPNDR